MLLLHHHHSSVRKSETHTHNKKEVPSMDDFRSKSYGDGRMQQIERYSGVGPTTSSGININSSHSSSNNMQDFRCYSASYATSAHPAETQNQNESKFKKGKSTNGAVSKSWSFNDPELQRKKRVASYKVYTVEGKVKGSFRKTFRWLKNTCTRAVHGW